jgi:Concanavalin A-like lectin/glucanases superfamily
MKRLIWLFAVLLCVSCASSKKKCTAPPSNMTAWWPFDSGSSATAHDIAMFDNAGTASGGVMQDANGKVAGAACFDGSTSEIVVPSHPEVDFADDCSLDFAEAFTIDFWIRTGASGGVHTVLDKRVSSANFLRGWSVYTYNGRPGFQMATGGGNSACGSAGSACENYTATASPSIADGNWHFVAIVVQPRCRGAAGFIYVDGAVVLNFHPRVGSISNNAPLHVGRREPSLGGEYFRGCLDELEIFERGLSVGELNAIYGAGANGKCKPKS